MRRLATGRLRLAAVLTVASLAVLACGSSTDTTSPASSTASAATASIGRREQDNSVDYTGWNAGFTYALTRRLEAEVRYHATDADLPGEQYADALVAGISVAF